LPLREGLEQKFTSRLSGVFPFLGPRCAGIADRAMERLQRAT
jgi:hypothetical protein